MGNLGLALFPATAIPSTELWVQLICKRIHQVSGLDLFIFSKGSNSWWLMGIFSFRSIILMKIVFTIQQVYIHYLGCLLGLAVSHASDNWKSRFYSLSFKTLTLILAYFPPLPVCKVIVARTFVSLAWWVIIFLSSIMASLFSSEWSWNCLINVGWRPFSVNLKRKEIKSRVCVYSWRAEVKIASSSGLF